MTEGTSSKPSKANIYFYAVGRRKDSVARIRMYADGKGDITINDKPHSSYFTSSDQDEKALAPLRLIEKIKAFDFTILVEGGGVTGQAEAIRHGISRALVEYDGELRSVLKKAGFLRRDPRAVERKHFGLKKARRAPQFSKR